MVSCFPKTLNCFKTSIVLFRRRKKGVFTNKDYKHACNNTLNKSELSALFSFKIRSLSKDLNVSPGKSVEES